MQPQPITFDQLYAEHSPALHRFAVCLTRDHTEAEEIVSETFFRAWTAPVPARATTARSYLFTIARNLHYDRLRSHARHQQVTETMPSNSASLDDHIALNQTLSKLDSLEENYRLPLLLFAIGGLTHQEIAAILSISPGLVKVRIHRARLKLAELLESPKQETLS